MFILITGLLKHVGGFQQPAVVVNSGDSADILCTTQGDGYAYFWRKGPSFNDSIYIASIVRGLHDSMSERFSVSSEGILTISNITSEDEGIYFCRLVSDDNDCHGHVDVYVNGKLSVQNRQSNPNYRSIRNVIFAYGHKLPYFNQLNFTGFLSPQRDYNLTCEKLMDLIKIKPSKYR